MTSLTPQEIMLAAALVFGIATTCQVVAPLLRIPALILLLPAGFLLGAAAPQFRMDQILGSAFPVAVDLMVAVILFQGGLELGTISLARGDKAVVSRLLWLGAPVTWGVAAVATHFLIGLDWPLATLLGAILIVSGPTVLNPILDFAQPTQRVRGVLMWEGTTLDPIGGILAVVIFQVIRVSNTETPADAVIAFVFSIAVAVVVAAAGVALSVLGIKAARGNKVIGTQVLIGTILAAAGFANFLSDDSGLLTALLMGVASYPIAKRMHAPLEATVPFFSTVASFGIGVLFVSIAALVPAALVVSVALPALAVALVLMVVVRPAVTALSSRKSSLTRNERIFIACMDPRGIVAAATASSVGAALIAAEVPGAAELLPAAFVIIAVTVFVYGLSATPLAKALGVREPSDTG